MDEELPLAVLDTSALYGRAYRKRLVEAALSDEYVGVWSPHVIAELFRVLTVQWIKREGTSDSACKRMSQSAKKMHELLLATFELVDTSPGATPPQEHWSDPDDAHLLTAANLAHASIIVSENMRDFPPADNSGRHVWGDIEFLVVDEFFHRLEAGTLPTRQKPETIRGEIEHPLRT